MPENMSISVNGQSQVPPGFRFHPTEEELLQYYLRKKVSYEKIDLDVIRDVDLNKLEPWDIQEKCKIGSTPQNDWYFFSHKDKKYPTGTRTNRATAAGFWKATGRDKVIFSNSIRIGMRKTLVFYKGRAPHGLKSDWIMHEYRLDDNSSDANNVSDAMGETTQEDGWVVCRIFKKKNHHKTMDSPMSSSITAEARSHGLLSSSSDDQGTLEQILQHMGKTCKEEMEENNGGCSVRPIDAAINNGLHDRFIKLPSLESSHSISSQFCYQQTHVPMLADIDASITHRLSGDLNSVYNSETGLNHDLLALDGLVASHLNGQNDMSKQLACFHDPTSAFCSSIDHELQIQQLRSSSSLSSYNPHHASQDYNSECDLWSFTRSSADPQYYMSNSNAVYNRITL